MKRLDPKLRRLIKTYKDTAFVRRDLESAVVNSPRLTRNSDGTFPDVDLASHPVYKRCLVVLKGSSIPEQLSQYDWNLVVDSIYSVNLPLDRLEEVGQLSSIEFVEAGRSFSPMLNTSVAEANATQARLATELRGTGVIVGIIDSGLDYSLDDFRNEDGTTRVAFIWDQSLEPTNGEHSPTGFNYGVEYNSENINGGLNGAGSIRHASTIGSHGTHVAGISVGNGRSHDADFPVDDYVGVAPNATIIHVAPNSGDQSSTFTDSSNVADAIAYIYRKAESMGLPCVINMSLGQNGGSHDGESLVERAIDKFLEVSGRAFVSAAGNEHVWRGHASGVLESGTVRELAWKAGGNIPWQSSPFNGQPLSDPEFGDFSPNEMEIWVSSRDDIRVRVSSPSGAQTGWVSSGESQLDDLGNGNSVFIDVERFTILNGDARAYIEIDPVSNLVEKGVWRVEIDAVSIRDGRFDAFIERDFRLHRVQLQNGTERLNFFADQSFFLGSDFDPTMTLGTPATSRRGIAVANYDHQTQSPNLSSSRGPTRDLRHKPEIAAPGTNIVAANALGGETGPNGDAIPVRVAKTGTSMSAPHVTGVIALMLERNPNLSAAQIRELIVASASTNTSGGAFDPAWGYGRLDATAAIDLLDSM